MEGNLIRTIGKKLEFIHHFQIADNQGRNEPGTGEINYSNILKFIDNSGYKGWVGCEYIPKGNTFDGLKWIENLRIKLCQNLKLIFNLCLTNFLF